MSELPVLGPQANRSEQSHSPLASCWFPDFEARTFEVNGTSIFARYGGNPDHPALLLVHGYPESHLMWHLVARRLRERYYLVIPDLRGYGDSAKPEGLPDHSNYSKRTMADDLVAVMRVLKRPKFYLCGHDRGARVSARLALDHPERVVKLSLIDIAPTLDMYRATTSEFARIYFHWFLLIQPAPLPELMIGGNAAGYLRALLGGGEAVDHLEPGVAAEYERVFCTPEAIHSSTEDYRASAAIDLLHDQQSRDRGEQIRCDIQVILAEYGAVHQLFDAHALWQAQCSAAVNTTTMRSGHFIPEVLPDETAESLARFFTSRQA